MTNVNPALPITEIVIDGTTYKMCLSYRALAIAETALVAQGHNVNMLAPMLSRNLTTLRMLFAASIYHHHPDISFEDAQELVTPGALMDIVAAVDAAWAKSIPEPEATGRPLEPEQ